MNMGMRSAAIRGIIAAIAGLVLASAAMAQSRPAGGKPCYATEKTYYAEDGVTPFACAPAGGPAYRFEVSLNGKELWSGTLATTEPEVYFALPDLTSGEKVFSPQLIVRRDLEADPTGRTVFFGERHVAGTERYETKDGTSSVSLPQLLEVGQSIRTRPGDRVIAHGTLPGAIVKRNDYLFVIYAE